MQNLIKQLENFNEQIQTIDDFSNNDADYKLIGIKFYRFIQDNPILKKEFNKRAEYLKNLSIDDDFTKIQEAMINIAWERAVLLKNKEKELDLIQKKCSYQKMAFLKNAGDNYTFFTIHDHTTRMDNIYTFFTIRDHITRMQDKENYYRLGDRIPIMDKTSKIINVAGLKEQFDNLYELVSVICLNTDDQKIKNELRKRDKEYDDLYRQLIEKLDNKPAEINRRPFEEVYVFALCTTPHKGFEIWYHSTDHQYHNFGNNKRFYDIKKYCNDVIKDLIFYLQGLENKQPTENKNCLKSIHLITDSLEPKNAIFLVLDERFEMPIRFAVKTKDGNPAYIKKLYDIAYFVNVPNKMVNYAKNIADGINNGLFKKIAITKYMITNKFSKPTLVGKSNQILVLKNEILVKTGLIKNDVPMQYQSIYTDKIR